MTKRITLFTFLPTIIIISFLLTPFSSAQLSVGFYDDQCPQAESIVFNAVASATGSNPRLPAELLRLHFHDCFVDGCDGSILIDVGSSSEKNADSHQGLAGFEVVDNAKAQLEAVCPGVVSCSDILALATRDGIGLASGPRYDVPTGRRDGVVSDRSRAGNMPEVDDSSGTLMSKFRNKGFSDEELVLLSASHSIGTTACFFMNNRLNNFSPQSASDPTIDPQFINELQATCPQGGDVNVRLAIDRGSEFVFDRSILQNMRDGLAVLASDARLYEDSSTRGIVDFFLDGNTFESDYVAAIVKLGQLDVLTGFDGEIRQFCSSFN